MEYVLTGIKDTAMMLTSASLLMLKWKNVDLQIFALDQIANSGTTFQENTLFQKQPSSRKEQTNEKDKNQTDPETE